MVFCTYCGQSFTRDEHLERHILTHTNVKPFKCFTCHMSFARRDLLQRHYTVHGRDQNNQEGLPPNNGMIPKSAGRTPIACSNCAKTKTKCDKKFPCSRCAGRNLRCTLRPTRRASKQQIASRMNSAADGTANGSASEISSSENQNGSSTGNSPQSQPQLQLQQGQPTQSEQTAQGPLQNPTPEDKSSSGEGPPTFFEHSPQSSQAPIMSNVISPITPPTGFVQTTPMSGYEDFVRTNHTRDGSETAASPPFLMDWAHMQMASGYAPLGRADLMLATDMGLDMNGLPAGPSTDGMLTMIPELAQALPPVPTPLTTPRMDPGNFSDLELGSSASIFYPTRHPSISDSGVSDLGPIVAAQDGWNVFRSSPAIPPSSCPRTAKLNLERLEQSLRNHEGWSKWRPAWDEADFPANDCLTIMQLHESTRDKLLAITQSFLHKALDIHREGGRNTPSRMDSPGSTGSNFVLLPPARVLECFLRSYANTFERFFPLTSRGMLDANELMQCYNDKASSLLLLMMIAQGAMVMPSLEARSLTGGLTEACRISLFDVIEKNIIMASDPIVLRSAVLFTVQAAWSGDKWQMDIAMGQRGMYFAMLRHSGILEQQTVPTSVSHRGTTDGLWSDWITQESRSRLIYSWLMVDQDLSLFHDTAPIFSVTEFGVPMPDCEQLWKAKTSTEWSEIFNQVHEFTGGFPSVGSGARPLSLRDLFCYFLDDEIITQGIELTPLHLRLLLHPLQSLVCQQSQLLSCFSDAMANRNHSPLAITASSTRQRMEEIQTLLQRWYDIAERYMKNNPMCVTMQASLALFHLISLNTVTNFTEIERLARREGFDGTYQQLMWLHKRCIADVNEAIFHAGQAMRLIRSMPRSIRPPWWPGAIYRIALVLWTDSLTHNDGVSPSANGMYSVSGMSFAVDSLPPEHPLVVRFLTKHEGVPALTKRDGTLVPLDHSYTVLSHCVDVIDEGAPTRFSDGIRAKLERLARG